VDPRPGAPKIITSPPKPEKWSVKDTTVNIATAFSQAASDTMPIQSQNPHNQSWASTSRSYATVPRSTSVEYETESQMLLNRRAANARNAVRATSKPLSKAGSSGRIVPDSEGEDNTLAPQAASVRGKSPFASALDTGARVLSAATYYVRQRSQEPDGVNGKDPSYDYSAEERDFQSTQAKKSATHKKNRMSVDNKAYKPSVESEDDSDEDFEDDDKKKRKKKGNKKELSGLRLPVISADKQRRRRKKAGPGEPGDEEEEGASDEAVSKLSVSLRICSNNSRHPRKCARNPNH
jgi:SUN domain-containing protein 1/2